MTLLTVSDLNITYHTRDGDRPVVIDANFEVKEAEIVGLVGESGSGKSALVHAIAALPRPVAATIRGQIRLGDVDMISSSHRMLRAVHGTRLGFVGQNPFGCLHPTIRIGKQFHTVLAAHKRTNSRSDSLRKAEAALESVGIRDPRRVLSGYANQLSGGMAQRVVIALATILEPKFFIADEPTTALDPTVQVQILDVLRGLRTDVGMSIFMVTHDLGVVANYCDKALVMRSGEIVEQNTVLQLFTSPDHPYTRELLDVDEPEYLK